MNKLSFCLILMLFVFSNVTCLYAEDFRKWTDAESERQIDGKIVDKKLDDSEAKLLMRNGKSVWIKAKRLVKEDQDYITNWVKPVDHITARVKGVRKGIKTIEVTAVAGSRPLTVKAYWRDKGKQPDGYPKVFKLQKGEEKTFTYEASSQYMVRGWAGNELVDEEAWNNKTGL